MNRHPIGSAALMSVLYSGAAVFLTVQLLSAVLGVAVLGGAPNGYAVMPVVLAILLGAVGVRIAVHARTRITARAAVTVAPTVVAVLLGVATIALLYVNATSQAIAGAQALPLSHGKITMLAALPVCTAMSMVALTISRLLPATWSTKRVSLSAAGLWLGGFAVTAIVLLVGASQLG